MLILFFYFFILYMKHLISKEALFTFLPFYFFTVSPPNSPSRTLV